MPEPVPSDAAAPQPEVPTLAYSPSPPVGEGGGDPSTEYRVPSPESRVRITEYRVPSTEVCGVVRLQRTQVVSFLSQLLQREFGGLAALEGLVLDFIGNYA